MQNQPEISHITFKPLPGLFTEFSARQAQTENAPRYVNGQWVRFHDGRPQKMGGYVTANYSPVVDAGGYSWNIIGVPRGKHIWEDLNGQEWICFGTAAKLYLLSLNQLYDITPLRRQVNVTNAITTTESSTLVTITDDLNNALTGDYVNITNAQEYNGVTLNGQYEVVATGTDFIQVNAHTEASASGTGGGTITIAYDITAGVDTPGFYYGWGSGVWSQGTWGTPRTAAGTSNTVGGTAYVSNTESGTVVINGTATGTITNTGVAETDLDAIATAINDITSTTGVTATVYLPPSSSGATWTPSGMAWTARITLSNSSGDDIVVSVTGSLTAADTGLSLGTFEANQAGMVQPIRLWACDNWGEDLMASIRDGSVYYWERTTGPFARAIDISLNPQYPDTPGAPVNSWWSLVSQTNQQLICLGASHDGVNDGLYIAISDTDDYNDFTPTSTNEAWTGRLSSGSRIITGIRTRNGIYIQTDTAAYLLQNNATSVYSSEELAENVSILSPNAAIDVEGTIYVMGLRKFFTFSGRYDEIACDVWSQVYNNFNYALTDMVTAWYDDQWSEVWWFYPSAEATENDSYVVYNFRDKHWTFGTIQRTSGLVTSTYYNYPIATDASGNVWMHENGYDEVLNGTTSAIDAYVQTYDAQTVQRSPYGAITPGRGLAYNEGAEQIHISMVVTDIIELVGQMYLTIQTKRYPGDVYSTKGPYPIYANPATGDASAQQNFTDLLSVRARGKLANFTYGSNTAGAYWRIGDFTFGTQDDGER